MKIVRMNKNKIEDIFESNAWLEFTGHCTK